MEITYKFEDYSTFVEIKGDDIYKIYNIQFIENEKILHQSDIKENHWTICNKKSSIIKIFNESILIFEKYNPKDRFLSKQIRNLIFFNYANNGDIFTSREFIKYIINNTKAEKYIYQQKNSGRLLLDIEKLEHSKEINGDVRDGIYSIEDDVYINTWYNCLTYDKGYWSKGRYNNGSNLKSLYDYFFNELPLTLNIKISENMYDFIPTIDFSKYNISKITNFMSINKNKEKIFIANGDAKSNQSDNNINFDVIIDKISNYYKDMLIFVSNPSTIKKENVVYIKDLLTEELDNDMYECSYVSTFCKCFIGRFSGVSTCTYIKDNMYKNKFYILVVNEKSNWDIDFSLKECGTEFIPCNQKNTEDVSNFILDTMKGKNFEMIDSNVLIN